ncbi:nucleotidyltransferase [Lentibacillus salicampi]|uniref:tRNA(Met) cytidine acetate ligase n=1 Tax=Lentibacillus salicampi TaxID=175306 RepID=A0A4Y9AF96_9BACI|nr:nucleotidyltransferase [Lentibacillus salicampi]TFJ94548.1 nucleotidyltransferase [Lentibacillus salicampi]
MQACGLIVEYNPFHNGHVFHIEGSRKATGADCLIAVMSGSFLQRGEPAIIDKFHRTKAALSRGVDIVLELPYLYAVQSSDLFAKGSVQTLHEIGASSICFGSESGDISRFTRAYDVFQQKNSAYQTTLQEKMDLGISFPEASRLAYQEIGLAASGMDLTKPNNILGFSYVKAILDNGLSIDPLTITRTKSDYHDQTITGSIASATSIRRELLKQQNISEAVAVSLPEETTHQLWAYKQEAGVWHSWEDYFHLVHYRVMTMTEQELAAIHGVVEGLENRIKQTARDATSFHEWINKIKTKRYTWTRLQRIFVHILTNTTKTDAAHVQKAATVPYVRLLGMTNTGQTYLNARKKEMNVPLISTLAGGKDSLLTIEERASRAYYSIIPGEKKKFFHQELEPPIMM